MDHHRDIALVFVECWMWNSRNSLYTFIYAYIGQLNADIPFFYKCDVCNFLWAKILRSHISNCTNPIGIIKWTSRNFPVHSPFTSLNQLYRPSHVERISIQCNLYINNWFNERMVQKNQLFLSAIITKNE